MLGRRYELVVDQAKMAEQMGLFGWRSAAPQEIPELVALGESLIGDKLADAETVERVHGVTGITAWAFGAPIEGIVLSVPLSIAGLAEVKKELQAQSASLACAWPSHPGVGATCHLPHRWA